MNVLVFKYFSASGEVFLTAKSKVSLSLFGGMDVCARVC